MEWLAESLVTAFAGNNKSIFQEQGTMSIVTTKELFKAAYGKYAIGAYNINNLEQCMGLFRGNIASKARAIRGATLTGAYREPKKIT